jgi:hypothetical protein
MKSRVFQFHHIFQSDFLLDGWPRTRDDKDHSAGGGAEQRIHFFFHASSFSIILNHSQSFSIILNHYSLGTCRDDSTTGVAACVSAQPIIAASCLCGFRNRGTGILRCRMAAPSLHANGSAVSRSHVKPVTAEGALPPVTGATYQSREASRNEPGQPMSRSKFLCDLLRGRSLAEAAEAAAS